MTDDPLLIPEVDTPAAKPFAQKKLGPRPVTWIRWLEYEAGRSVQEVREALGREPTRAEVVKACDLKMAEHFIVDGKLVKYRRTLWTKAIARILKGDA